MRPDSRESLERILLANKRRAETRILLGLAGAVAAVGALVFCAVVFVLSGGER